MTMTTNLERYKADLEILIAQGDKLYHAMQKECYPKEYEEKLKTLFKTTKKVKEVSDSIPKFTASYQAWYSESLAIIKQVLPERLDDFKRQYEKPK